VKKAARFGVSCFVCGSIGVVRKNKKKRIEMFEVKAYVTEIEPDNIYKVDIDGFETTVRACEEIDDSVVTFKSALTRVLEFKYGDCDVDFVCCGVKDGVCSYVVLIDDYVW
jgi:hypothetical protein